MFIIEHTVQVLLLSFNHVIHNLQVQSYHYHDYRKPNGTFYILVNQDFTQCHEHVFSQSQRWIIISTDLGYNLRDKFHIQTEYDT